MQIGHNVVIGGIASSWPSPVSGSAELGDFAALGGQHGVVGHVKIGAGAEIAGSSNVRGNVPPGVNGEEPQPSRRGSSFAS